MKATGIVRHIDTLGRVVIPKEIRRTMRLREGDPLEMFIGADGEIIFKKYSLVSGISPVAQPFAQALAQKAKLPVLITDNDRVCICAGVTEEDVAGRQVSRALEMLIEKGVDFIAEAGGESLLPMANLKRKAAVACPFAGSENAAGCVVMLMDGDANLPTQTEVALVQVAASFLEEQMES